MFEAQTSAALSGCSWAPKKSFTCIDGTIEETKEDSLTRKNEEKSEGRVLEQEEAQGVKEAGVVLLFCLVFCFFRFFRVFPSLIVQP